MQRRILLDSNILIQLVNNEILSSEIFFEDCEYSVSVITYMEVMGFQFKNESEEKTFEEIFKKFKMYFLDNDIVSQVIRIRKRKKIKLSDAIIAATCLAFDAFLMTRNEADFLSIPNLQVINPFKDPQK